MLVSLTLDELHAFIELNTRHVVMKRHLLSFNTFAMDEILLRVLDSF